MTFLAGIASIVGGAIFKVFASAARYVVIIAALAALGTATYKFSRMYFEIYSKIQGSIDGIGTTYGGLLGCVMQTLGIDDFMTSGLAIFTTASIFWGVSVAYIMMFKVTKTAYRYMIRATL